MSNAVTSTGILVKRAGLTDEATVVITSSSVAAASVITTAAPHGLTTKDEVTIADHTGSTPDINGSHIVTVLSPTTFSIPVAVTVAGADGTVLPTYRVVGELTEVTPGGKSRNKIETSTHNDGSESHVLGILRQSDPGFKINYVGGDSTHVQLNADIDNNIKAMWKFKFPSGVSRTGPAYVQQFMYDGAPVDGKQGATITLTWAGIVTELANEAA